MKKFYFVLALFIAVLSLSYGVSSAKSIFEGSKAAAQVKQIVLADAQTPSTNPLGKPIPAAIRCFVCNENYYDCLEGCNGNTTCVNRCKTTRNQCLSVCTP